MRTESSATTQRQGILTWLLRSKSRLGIAATLLGGAILPFTTGKADTPVVQNQPNLREMETANAKKWWPSIRLRLINMFKAEREDNKLLGAGTITEKERKVKVCYTDFVMPGEIGDDGGAELNLHIVKYYDDKQTDGSILRTYINEHWPINPETGGILPTETFRIRSQMQKGSLKEVGAEKLFENDLLQAVWGDNADGSHGNASMFAHFYRQHLYDENNKQNQVQVPVNTVKCMSCHSSRATFTQSIFLNKGEKKTDFGAITPDKEFEKPYNEQRGYKKYIKYLEERVKKGEIKQSFLDNAKKDLMNSTRIENPFIVEALEANQSIPWLDGDHKYDTSRFDYTAHSFNYKQDGIIWTKAIHPYYRDQLYGGTWWKREDFELIPTKR